MDAGLALHGGVRLPTESLHGFLLSTALDTNLLRRQGHRDQSLNVEPEEDEDGSRC